MNKWFFPNGMIKHHSYEVTPSENSILETIIGHFVGIGVPNLNILIKEYLKSYNEDSTQRSHDNITAIAVWAFLNDKTLLNQIKIFPKHTHPRDIIFLGILKGNLIAKLFSPLLLLIYIYMVVTPYKYRKTFLERLKNKEVLGKKIMDLEVSPSQKNFYYKPTQWGFNPYIIKRFYAVDTERLFWLRTLVNITCLNWINKVIIKMLQVKHKNANWFYVCNKFYLKEGHPITEKSKC